MLSVLARLPSPRYLSYHLSLDITCSYPGHIAKFTCAITGDIDITYAIRSHLTQGSYSSSLNQILRLFQSITQYSLTYTAHISVMKARSNFLHRHKLSMQILPSQTIAYSDF